MGYAAPEYMQTGRLTSKSDVWSYGVFLYELITGRRPVDRNRPKNEQKLLEWVKPYLSDAKKFQQILDPRLEGKLTVRSAHKLSLVANRCLARLSKSRPKMSEVLEMVNQVVEASSRGDPQPSLKSKDVKKPLEETEGKGKRRICDMKFGEGGWLLRVWSSKLVRTCWAGIVQRCIVWRAGCIGYIEEDILVVQDTINIWSTCLEAYKLRNPERG